MDDAARTSGLERIHGIWRRRSWLALAVFVASFAGATAGVMFLPNVYRATATVLVERQQMSESFVRPSVTAELDTRLLTVSQEILSRARLMDLIARFDLYPEVKKHGSIEGATERLRRDIKLELKGVQQMGGRNATIAFTLGYVGGDPQTVALVANTLASFYVEGSLRVRERQAARTAEFLKLQLETMKTRLDEQERRISDFKMQHIGELPQQVLANLATLTRLHEQLRGNDANQLRARERRAALAGQPTGGDGSAAAGGETPAARLSRLRRELTELRLRFTEKYPDVVRVKAEIAALEGQVNGRVAGQRLDPNEAMQQSEAELRALKAEEDSLRRDIAMYQRRVEHAPQREQELHQLSRDYETTKELYYSLVKRYQDAELAESMEQRQGGGGEVFRILDTAIAPRHPAAPNRPRLLLLGLMAALAVAAGAAVLADRLDTSFHSVDELRAFTPIPVLASIPRVFPPAEARRRWLRFALGLLGTLVAGACLVGAAYYVARDNEELVWTLSRGRS